MSNLKCTAVIVNKFCKSLCSRFCPDTLNFPLVTEVSNTSKIAEVGSSSALDWESLEREHRAYALLCHLIVSLEGKRDCIHRAVCASSTDNYPDESIENTLVLLIRDLLTGQVGDNMILECLRVSLIG